MFTEIRFRDFREQYPGFLPGVLLILGILFAIDLLLYDRQENYLAEINALRANMTQEQQQRGDAMSVSRQEQRKLMLQLVRRQAQFGNALHLSVDLDSSKIALVQEGAVLRTLPVELGAARTLSKSDSASGVMRGADSVVRVLGPADARERDRDLLAADHGAAARSDVRAPGGDPRERRRPARDRAESRAWHPRVHLLICGDSPRSCAMRPPWCGCSRSGA